MGEKCLSPVEIKGKREEGGVSDSSTLAFGWAHRSFFRVEHRLGEV